MVCQFVGTGGRISDCLVVELVMGERVFYSFDDGGEMSSELGDK